MTRWLRTTSSCRSCSHADQRMEHDRALERGVLLGVGRVEVGVRQPVARGALAFERRIGRVVPGIEPALHQPAARLAREAGHPEKSVSPPASTSCQISTNARTTASSSTRRWASADGCDEAERRVDRRQALAGRTQLRLELAVRRRRARSSGGWNRCAIASRPPRASRRPRRGRPRPMPAWRSAFTEVTIASLRGSNRPSASGRSCPSSTSHSTSASGAPASSASSARVTVLTRRW